MPSRVVGLRSVTGVVRRRLAVALDLENLVYGFREAGLLGEGVERVSQTLVSLVGDVVYGVAVCDRRLSRAAAHAMWNLGIRTFGHGGGPNAADRELLERLGNDLPPSTEVLVIGSGDHLFASLAAQLRGRGIHIVVISPRGGLSPDLRLVANEIILLDGPRTMEAA